MNTREQPQSVAASPQDNKDMEPETGRLLLREWKPDDIADLVEGLNDLRVSRWLAFVPHPYTPQAAEQWIQHCLFLSQKTGEPSGYEFAIELKAEQKVIGGVSLNRINRLHGTAGGGIWLHDHYQGKGYGSEAFGEKIRFAFEDLGLRRLENGFFRGNDASWAMQQRFGYQREGERRKAYRCMADNELKDECITGLLKEEWKRNL